MTPSALALGVAVLVAGALGAVVRAELVARAAGRGDGGSRARATGTAWANLVGTAVLAGVGAAAARGVAPPAVVAVVGLGFAGSLTTFSGWVVDAALTARAGGGLGRLALELAGQLAAGVALAVAVVHLAGSG